LADGGPRFDDVYTDLYNIYTAPVTAGAGWLAW